MRLHPLQVFTEEELATAKVSFKEKNLDKLNLDIRYRLTLIKKKKDHLEVNEHINIGNVTFILLPDLQNFCIYLYNPNTWNKTSIIENLTEIKKNKFLIETKNSLYLLEGLK